MQVKISRQTPTRIFVGSNSGAGYGRKGGCNRYGLQKARRALLCTDDSFPTSGVEPLRSSRKWRPHHRLAHRRARPCSRDLCVSQQLPTFPPSPHRYSRHVRSALASGTAARVWHPSRPSSSDRVTPSPLPALAIRDIEICVDSHAASTDISEGVCGCIVFVVPWF